MSLKEGMVVNGNTLANKKYAITTSDAIMKVLNVGSSTVYVEIIEHKINKSRVGHRYEIAKRAVNILNNSSSSQSYTVVINKIES